MTPFGRLEFVARHAAGYLLCLRLVHTGAERGVRELIGVSVVTFIGPELVTIATFHRTLVTKEALGFKMKKQMNKRDSLDAYRCFLDFPLVVVAGYLAFLRVARIDLFDFILITVGQVDHGFLTTRVHFDANELRHLLALTARSLLGNTSDSSCHRSEMVENKLVTTTARKMAF